MAVAVRRLGALKPNRAGNHFVAHNPAAGHEVTTPTAADRRTPPAGFLPALHGVGASWAEHSLPTAGDPEAHALARSRVLTSTDFPDQIPPVCAIGPTITYMSQIAGSRTCVPTDLYRIKVRTRPGASS